MVSNNFGKSIHTIQTVRKCLECWTREGSIIECPVILNYPFGHDYLTVLLMLLAPACSCIIFVSQSYIYISVCICVCAFLRCPAYELYMPSTRKSMRR